MSETETNNARRLSPHSSERTITAMPSSNQFENYNDSDEEDAIRRLEARGGCIAIASDGEGDKYSTSSGDSDSEYDIDSGSDTESVIESKKREATIRAQEDELAAKTLPGLALVDEQLQEMMQELSANASAMLHHGREMDEAAMGRLAHTQSAMSLQLFGRKAEFASLGLSSISPSTKTAITLTQSAMATTTDGAATDARSTLLLEDYLHECSSQVLDDLQARRDAQAKELADLVTKVDRKYSGALDNLVTSFHRHVQWVRKAYERKLGVQRESSTAVLRDVERLHQSILKDSQAEMRRRAREKIIACQTKYNKKLQANEENHRNLHIQNRALVGHLKRQADINARYMLENEAMRARLGEEMKDGDMKSTVENMKKLAENKVKKFQREVLTLGKELEDARQGVIDRDRQVSDLKKRMVVQRNKIEVMQSAEQQGEAMLSAVRDSMGTAQKQLSMITRKLRENEKQLEKERENTFKANEEIKVLKGNVTSMADEMNMKIKKHAMAMKELNIKINAESARAALVEEGKRESDCRLEEAHKKLGELQMGILNAITAQKEVQGELNELRAQAKEVVKQRLGEITKIEQENENRRSEFDRASKGLHDEVGSLKEMIVVRDKEIVRLQGWAAQLRVKFDKQRDVHRGKIISLSEDSREERERLEKAILALENEANRVASEEEEEETIPEQQNAEIMTKIESGGSNSHIDTGGNSNVNADGSSSAESNSVVARAGAVVLDTRQQDPTNIGTIIDANATTAATGQGRQLGVVVDTARAKEVAGGASSPVRNSQSSLEVDVSEYSTNASGDDNVGSTDEMLKEVYSSQAATDTQPSNELIETATTEESPDVSTKESLPIIKSQKQSSRASLRELQEETAGTVGLGHVTRPATDDESQHKVATKPQYSPENSMNSITTLDETSRRSSIDKSKRSTSSRRLSHSSSSHDSRRGSMSELKKHVENEMREFVENELRKEVRIEMLARMERGLTKRIRAKVEVQLRQTMADELQQEKNKIEEEFGRSSAEWIQRIEDQKQLADNLRAQMEVMDQTYKTIAQKLDAKAVHVEKLMLSIKEKDVLLLELSQVTHRYRKTLSLHLKPLAGAGKRNNVLLKDAAELREQSADLNVLFDDEEFNLIENNNNLSRSPIVLGGESTSSVCVDKRSGKGVRGETRIDKRRGGGEVESRPKSAPDDPVFGNFDFGFGAPSQLTRHHRQVRTRQPRRQRVQRWRRQKSGEEEEEEKGKKNVVTQHVKVNKVQVHLRSRMRNEHFASSCGGGGSGDVQDSRQFAGGTNTNRQGVLVPLGKNTLVSFGADAVDAIHKRTQSRGEGNNKTK